MMDKAPSDPDRGALIRLQQLMAATEKADPKPEDVEALQALFVASPNLWRAARWSRGVALTLIGDLSDGKEPHHQILTANYDGVLRDFGYAQAGSGLEKLLIEHVALCWLRMQSAESRYSNVMAQKSLTFAQGEYWEKRLSAAQRRYLRAIETLARIRRLALPVVQVNVAEKQVNIAGGA